MLTTTVGHFDVIWSSAFAVGISNWVVIAIRKHVAPEESLTGAGEGVGIDETVDDRVVIAALEVIPSRFWCYRLPLRANWAVFERQTPRNSHSSGRARALPDT